MRKTSKSRSQKTVTLDAKKTDPKNLVSTQLKENEMSQYIFTFELLRQYPNVRSFIIKQPLKRSFKDQVSELLGGKKR